ncbi:MAG: gluconokinase, partial [Mesorhizobium sp.]
MAASRPASEPGLIVVMGVSGCGKTSIGEGIAARLGIGFVEGDALHPIQNVEKMSAGVPLDDADRWPWLDLVGRALRTAQGDGLVVTCSALKKAYRDRLRQAAGGDLVFVFL